MLPIVRKQGNAFMAAPRVHGERFHYFDTGIKRLIIELEMDDFAIFLVHLSLKYRHRHSAAATPVRPDPGHEQTRRCRRRFQYVLG